MNARLIGYLAGISLLFGGTGVFAFEPGDRVVVIGTDTGFQMPQGPFLRLRLGACFDVIQVEEGRAYIESSSPGWIPFEDLLAPQDALEHFRKLIKDDPENLDYLVACVRVYCELEEYEPALEELTEAIQGSPEPMLYSLRGDVYVFMDCHDEAILDYKQAIGLREGTPSLYRNIGKSYYQLGEYENALGAMQNAIDLDGMSANDFLMCSQLCDRLGRQKDQFEYLIESATLYSHNSMTQNNLAWILATSPNNDLRDGPRAIRHAMLACILTNFTDPVCLETLSAAYAEDGNFEQAISCAEKALMLLPEDGDTAPSETRLELYRQGQPYRDLLSEESEPGTTEDAEPARKWRVE